MNRRLPLSPGSSRGAVARVTVDGRPVEAYASETVAAALLAGNVDTFRHTQDGAPRAVFCGMGVCFDCLVVIDGVPNQRACMTRVRDGMVINTQDGLAASKSAD